MLIMPLQGKRKDKVVPRGEEENRVAILFGCPNAVYLLALMTERASTAMSGVTSPTTIR